MAKRAEQPATEATGSTEGAGKERLERRLLGAGSLAAGIVFFSTFLTLANPPLLVTSLSLAVSLGLLLDLVLVRRALKFWNDVQSETGRLQGRLGSGDADAPVACARRGCGAMYHQECWDECRTSYGACAVFGCGSTVAEGVTEATLKLRVARMFLAALLFSPRLLEKFGQADGEGGDLSSLREVIGTRAREAHANMWSQTGHQRRGRWTGRLNALQLLSVLGSFGVSSVLCLSILFGGGGEGLAYSLLFGIPLAAVLALFGGSWFLAFFIYAAKAVLAGEFAALSRLGAEGSYLGKARAMLGKGKGK